MSKGRKEAVPKLLSYKIFTFIHYHLDYFIITAVNIDLKHNNNQETFPTNLENFINIFK